jgi:hypothetical protein
LRVCGQDHCDLVVPEIAGPHGDKLLQKMAAVPDQTVKSNFHEKRLKLSV